MSPWQHPSAEITLNEVQLCALAAVVSAQGGFFPIGVGHGKTFIALLVGMVLDRQAVVFVPAHTVTQITEELERLRQSFVMRHPVVIIPYSQISMPDGRSRVAQRLSHLDPQNICVVLDEAHAIKNPKSARTRRILDLCSMLRCPVVALSGTMTNRYAADFEHIAQLALPRSFLPTDPAESHTLHTALAEPTTYDRYFESTDADTAWTESELDEGFADTMGHTSAQVRESIQARMKTWAGVHATSSTSVGASLRLTKISYSLSDDLKRAIADAYAGYTPHGVALVEPVEKWLLLRTLSSGWWYELIWSSELPPEFFVARKRFFGLVRALVDDGQFETAGGCITSMRRRAEQGSDDTLSRAWQAWEPWSDHPKPDRIAHVIDTAPVRQIASLAMQGDPCIVWYHYAQTADLLESCGLKVWRAGQEPLRTPHFCAMSIPSHGEGLNLQQWRKSVVLEPPTTGKSWEQMLGRLHRRGTPHDEIWFSVAHATISQKNAYYSAMRDARYVEAVMGQQQKLCLTRLI
jgi:hypothetical protein